MWEKALAWNIFDTRKVFGWNVVFPCGLLLNLHLRYLSAHPADGKAAGPDVSLVCGAESGRGVFVSGASEWGEALRRNQTKTCRPLAGGHSGWMANQLKYRRSRAMGKWGLDAYGFCDRSGL